jgi:hypothetical protein
MEKNLANRLCSVLEKPSMAKDITLGCPTQLGDLVDDVFVARKVAKMDRLKGGDLVIGDLWVEDVHH